jgi:hypothetical protein
LVLAVDFILKRSKGVSLVCQTMSIRSGKRAVVENLSLLQVLQTNLMQLSNCPFVFLGGCSCKEAEWLRHKDRLKKYTWASSEDSFTYHLRQHI